MPFFIKKPIPVEMIQFNKPGDHPAVQEDPTSPTGFGIFTLEHTARKHEVTPGDWIVNGNHGDVYAIKDHIKTATYDEVPTE